MIQPDQKIKRDAGKLRMDLIPPQALVALASVMTFGAEKYPAGSWREVEPWRYHAAALRHLVAWMQGSRKDAESGLPHLWHALTNIAFLIELEEETEDENHG